MWLLVAVTLAWSLVIPKQVFSFFFCVFFFAPSRHTTSYKTDNTQAPGGLAVPLATWTHQLHFPVVSAHYMVVELLQTLTKNVSQFSFLAVGNDTKDQLKKTPTSKIQKSISVSWNVFYAFCGLSAANSSNRETTKAWTTAQSFSSDIPKPCIH